MGGYNATSPLKAKGPSLITSPLWSVALRKYAHDFIPRHLGMNHRRRKNSAALKKLLFLTTLTFNRDQEAGLVEVYIWWGRVSPLYFSLT